MLDIPGQDKRSIKIFKPLTSIGRASENDIVVTEAGLEKTHAHITRQGQTFLITGMLRDMTINGRREKNKELQDKDLIRIGNLSITYYAGEAPVENLRVPSLAQPGQTPLQTIESRSAYRRIHEFSLRLLANDSTSALVESILDSVIDLTGADKGFLVLLDDDTNPSIRAARNIDHMDLQAEVIELSDSILQKVIESREPLIVADALSHDEFNASASVVSLKLLSVMCCPLLCRDELKGILYVGNNRIAGVFDEAALDTLTVFAAQASLLLAQAERLEEIREEKEELVAELEGVRYGNIVGTSTAMENVFKRLEKVATTDISVLITGETGTGKELIARQLHHRSPRAKGPFVVINCGAIPENLLESELFGHMRGAFTGAVSNKKGHFQVADKGTLFLDEIGEMPLSLQVKLLRAIQEKIVLPVGGHKPEKVDIRIVAATHQNLAAQIKAGQFREDLFYRLNVVNIHLPALRERDDDIILLAKYFLSKTNKELGLRIKGFSKSCLSAVRQYGWPGNIRQLENRIRKAVVLADSDLLTAEDLDLQPSDIEDILSLAAAKERFQARYINEILARNGGNRSKTARDLGVDARTIFRHLKKINSPIPEENHEIGLEID